MQLWVITAENKQCYLAEMGYGRKSTLFLPLRENRQ